MQPPELAAPQIYILLAITVAAFAWLLKPGRTDTLEKRHAFVPLAIIVPQVWRIVGDGMRAEEYLHSVLVLLWMICIVWLFRSAWQRDRSAPPPDPPDLETAP